MATKDELKQVATRAINDPNFADQLRRDPAAAARDMGIELSENEASMISSALASSHGAADQADRLNKIIFY